MTAIDIVSQSANVNSRAELVVDRKAGAVDFPNDVAMRVQDDVRNPIDVRQNGFGLTPLCAIDVATSDAPRKLVVVPINTKSGRLRTPSFINISQVLYLILKQLREFMWPGLCFAST